MTMTEPSPSAVSEPVSQHTARYSEVQAILQGVTNPHTKVKVGEDWISAAEFLASDLYKYGLTLDEREGFLGILPPPVSRNQVHFPTIVETTQVPPMQPAPSYQTAPSNGSSHYTGWDGKSAAAGPDL